MVCPLSSAVRGQGRLLAGHSLVEVDVAQVLGWLLRGTHFLVIVDHPPGEAGRGRVEKDEQIGHPLRISLVSDTAPGVDPGDAGAKVPHILNLGL